MQRRSRHLLTVVALFLLIQSSSFVYARSLPLFPGKYTSDWVFSIHNNLVPSRVVYAVTTVDTDRLSGKEPVYNYMYRPSGNNPRELSLFENANAYGIRSQFRENQSQVRLVLEKYPSIPITIKLSGGRARAYVYVDDKRYRLYSIYVHAKKELLGMKVIYVNLVMYDFDSKKVVAHRLR